MNEITVPNGFGLKPSPYRDIDDLQLNDAQKAAVMEWLAMQMWHVMERLTENSYYGKSYDPLLIDLENGVMRSYVFDFKDGGRTHPFESFKDTQDDIVNEVVEYVAEWHGWTVQQ